MTSKRERPFSWSPDEVRRVGYRVVDLIAEHLAGLPEQPVVRPVPPALALAMRSEPLPATGMSADDILQSFARDIAPHPFGNGHPRFYGWVNSPPAVMGVFGAALAAAMNPSVAGGNHAAVHLERQVIRWFRELLGFPDDTMGLLVSGTSTAALTGLAVARHVACQRNGWNVRAAGMQSDDGDKRRPRLTVYQSAEGHSCHQKAIELLGFGHDSLRIVASDGALRMRPDALNAMIAQDRAAGRLPVAVIASVGTVNTGAIDPIGELADICGQHGVWLHIDGGYGGPALLTSDYDDLRDAFARADSVAVDPHKWLYVPVDAGLVLIRDRLAMRDAFSLVPPYLRTEGDDPWLSEFGLEQTRPFRALKIWMALQYFGLEGYRTLIEHDLVLAHYLAERVRHEPELELWEPQGLSIVCFRVVPAGLRDDAAIDSLNRRILSALQAAGRAFLSSTVLNGCFWLRACIVNPRATESDVEAMLAEVQRRI
jgi:aromatic-L-amino-acid/L-tryptophan decarboxylase